MDRNFKVFTGTKEEFDRLRQEKFLEIKRKYMKKEQDEFEDLDWEDLEEDAMRDDNKLPIPENFLQDACWSEILDREIDDDIYD